MSLTAGARLGPYEIVAPLGAGGMGEVYRARDTHLHRDVAVKILPETFAADPDRVARFEREARTLATLNHPHIAQVFGLEKTAGLVAIIMELVEGDDLAARLSRGPIEVDDAVPIARQLAEALEAAHDAGIVHRDLKPANIKLRPDGVIKVLDFGLAKALQPDGSGATPASTMTSPAMTQAGIILGTAAYMAPEQAKGRVVDRRADIWAFGCVVFEMLAGRRPFGGEDLTDTITAIMRDAPAWSLLPRDTPPRLRDLLARCLEKDPRKRLRDIGEARLVLDSDMSVAPPAVSSAAPAPKARWSLLLAGLALVAGAVLGAGAVFLSWPSAEPPSVVRATIPLAASAPYFRDDTSSITVSPDGRVVVYVSARGNSTVLVAHDLETGTDTTLPGSEGALRPFFSPRGDFIAFMTPDWQLKRLPAAGGTAVTIGSGAQDLRGASWGDDDWIVTALGATAGLSRIKASGGTFEPLTTPDRAAGEKTHRFPEVLPGGRAVIYTSGSSKLETYSDARIVVRDLKSGETRTLVEGGVGARYVQPGYLVYGKAGSIFAVKCDARALRISGTPVEIQADVSMRRGTGSPDFVVSRRGLLVYVAGGEISLRRRIVWVNQQGQAQPITDDVRGFNEASLSDDGSRLLVVTEMANNPLWTFDLRSGVWNRLTNSWDASNPVQSPDGRVIFVLNQDREYGRVFAMPAAGGEPQLVLDQQTNGLDAYPRGDTVAIQTYDPTTHDDIALLSLATGKATPLIHGKASESVPALSPNGRLLAYVSDRSLPPQVYLVRVDRPDEAVQVSTAGGGMPRWASDRELFYTDGLHMMRVQISETGGRPVATRPETRFDVTKYMQWPPPYGTWFQITPGGQRFIMIEPLAEAAAPTELRLVTNWTTELARKLSGR